MKAAIIFSVFLLVAILAVNASEDDSGFKCKVGVNYKENKCNNCFCGADGGLGCTLMACTTHQDPKLMNCEKGTTWHDGCEQCWCTGMGTICTTDCGKVHDTHY